jgi:hypothetical protein
MSIYFYILTIAACGFWMASSPVPSLAPLLIVTAAVAILLVKLCKSFVGPMSRLEEKLMHSRIPPRR